MYRQEAYEEYQQALKNAQREYRMLTAEGRDPYPAVLDHQTEYHEGCTLRNIGTMEIPIDRIVGVKSSGRTAAFTAGFAPLLPAESEFGIKWINLCASHLSSGIREPIICYEFLGDFYVQEGNKRVSVLKHFGAPRVSAVVIRVVPDFSEKPHIQAYYEFMEFFSDSQIYDIQFRQTGEYAELLAHLGKESGEKWTEKERRAFSAYFTFFRDALASVRESFGDLRPEDALLLWLRVYSYQDLCDMTATQLRKSLSSLREDLMAIANEQEVQVQTQPMQTENKAGILGRLIALAPERVNVAFIHPMALETSDWIKGHDQGRIYVDGVDIRKIDMEYFRSQIGFVQQEPMMFHDTIFNNIAYGNEAYSVDDVIHAADIANAHEFIARQPDGYDSVLGERGVGLSGGERQRLSIARAVLKNPSILVFDEATASVDSETEHLIQEAIEHLISGRTTIMIAHRLSTVRNADMILVVRNGKIVEQGTHNELLKMQGYYHELYTRQYEDEATAQLLS